jgi:hypothetical protein
VTRKRPIAIRRDPAIPNISSGRRSISRPISERFDFRTFRGSPAPDWLRANAHRFGFVLPYTAAATELTGYIDEPWHGRWVGQALANRLFAASYLDWTDLDADDVIALVRAEAALDV